MSVDIWHHATVWAIIPPNRLWQAGLITQHEEIENGSWVFTVRDLNNTSYEITALSVDGSYTEFDVIKRRNPDSETALPVADMTSLLYLNEPEMLNCITKRFSSKRIYTGIGPILVAMNPFEHLPIYSKEHIDKYYEADHMESKALGPHVYQLSDTAYRKMLIDKFNPDKREDQVILVNGESGAGKTEATKQVLQYLAAVSARVLKETAVEIIGYDFETLITAANPITESFGNGKTSRNNNSSRFGKIIELLYVPDGYIDGATIRTYLLENVRVVFQMRGERNYHVFYETFAGLSYDVKSQWGLSSPKDFRYTNQSGEYDRYDGVCEEENFRKLEQAISQIGLTDEERMSTFEIVAGILHLGNISFEESSLLGSEGAVLSESSRSSIDHTCSLLGISETKLVSAITKRTLSVAGCEIEKALNIVNAASARDSMAKTLYDIVFKWMIQSINKSLCPDSYDEIVSSIGVLDIFGFEYFDKNSFEQLCINYANEKLQDHFNYATFKSQQELYIEEGLRWTLVDYPDNSERLELFEHKTTGIYALCDEQLKVAKPTDDKLAKTLYAKCCVKTHFSASKIEQSSMEFTVHHFACNVKYCTLGFLDKNRSEVALEINDCISSSLNKILGIGICGAFDDVPAEPSPRLSRSNSSSRRSTSYSLQRKNSSGMGIRVGKKVNTVASQFSKQLQGLIAKIRSTRSHFIRCIKPNTNLEPVVCDNEMVLSQLRCGGALEAVEVFRAGFQNRMEFSYFVLRYAAFLCACGQNYLTRDVHECMARAQHTGLEIYWRSAAAKLIDIVRLTATVLATIDKVDIPVEVDVYSGLQLGRTGIFLRATIFEYLERLYVCCVSMIARRLQRRWRARVLAKSAEALGQTFKYTAVSALMHFSDYKKRIVRDEIAARITLQRVSRVFLTVCRRKRVISGVTHFKACYRGYMDRLLVKRIKNNAATTIQSNFRCHIHHKKFQYMKKSTIYSQKIIRGCLSRMVKSKMISSVQLLQRAFRGSATRRKYAVVLEEHRLKLEAEKSETMKLLEAKIVENPRFLHDIEASAETMRQMREEIAALMDAKRVTDTKYEKSEVRCTLLSQTVAELTDQLSVAKHNEDCTLEFISNLYAACSDIFSVAELAFDGEQHQATEPTDNLLQLKNCVTMTDTLVPWIRKASSDLKNKSDTIADRDNTIASLTSRIRKLEIETADLTTHIAAVEDRNSSLQVENQELRDDIAEKEKEVGEMERALKRLENDASSHVNSVTMQMARIGTLEDELLATSDSLNRKEFRVNELESMLATLRNECQESKAALELAQQDYAFVNDISMEVDTLRSQRNEDMIIIEKLTKDIENFEAKIRANMKLEIDMQQTIDGLNARLSSFTSQIQSMETKETAMNENIESLREKLVHFDEEKSVAHEKLVESEERVTSLQNELNALATSKNEELMALQERITGLEHMLAESNAQIKDSEMALDIAKREHDCMVQLESDLESFKQEVDRLRTQNLNTEKNIQLKEKEYTTLKETMEDSLRIKSAENSVLLTRISELEECEAMLKLKVEESEAKSLRAESEHAALLNLTSELDSMRAQYNISEGCIQELNAKIDELLSENSKLADREINLKAVMDTASAEYDSVCSRLEGQVIENLSLRAENDSLQSKINAIESRCYELESHASVTDEKVLEHSLAYETLKIQAANECQALTDKIRELEETNSYLVSQSDKLRSEAKQASTKARETEIESRNTIRQYEHRMNDLKSQHTHRVSELNSRIEVLQSEIKELSTREVTLEQELDITREHVKNLQRLSYEGKYKSLRTEFLSLKARHHDLLGHFQHSRAMSSLATHLEAFALLKYRDSKKWRPPVHAVVEKWIRFSETEVVFAISIRLDFPSPSSWNTTAGNNDFEEYKQLLDANSTVVNSEFPVVVFSVFSPVAGYTDNKALSLSKRLSEINDFIAGLPSPDRLHEIPRLAHEVMDLFGLHTQGGSQQG